MLLLNTPSRNAPPRRAAATRRRPPPMTREELYRRMTGHLDCFGRLVEFVHPLEEPDGYRADPAEAKLLAKVRKWADRPQKYPAFERTLSEKILRHAREGLPFGRVRLVVSGRQQERMGRLPALRWRGTVLDCLAVHAQSSSNIWMCAKEPQLERIAGVAGRGSLRAVTLLLPEGYADPHAEPRLALIIEETEQT